MILLLNCIYRALLLLLLFLLPFILAFSASKFAVVNETEKAPCRSNANGEYRGYRRIRCNREQKITEPARLLHASMLHGFCGSHRKIQPSRHEAHSCVVCKIPELHEHLTQNLLFPRE